MIAKDSRTDRNSDSPSHRWRRERPENFSTYVPRELVRRLKVIAALRDVPLWTIVTDALEQYLEQFQDRHGRLPELANGDKAESRGKG